LFLRKQRKTFCERQLLRNLGCRVRREKKEREERVLLLVVAVPHMGSSLGFRIK